MDSKRIRYFNSRLLVAEVGGVSAFADRLGKEQPQASSIVGENPSKGIGPKIARQIDATFKKPDGWLDLPHYDEWVRAGFVEKRDVPIGTEFRTDTTPLGVSQETQRFIEKLTMMEMEGSLPQGLVAAMEKTVDEFAKAQRTHVSVAHLEGLYRDPDEEDKNL